MLTILLAVALFSGASAADDFCVKSACGCGADGKPWCSEDNYKVGGSWCNANSANCGNCGGDWCAAAAAEYSYSYGPFCVKTACGCDADGKDWCDRESYLQGGDWCNANEANCNNCAGDWCYERLAPAPSPTDMPVKAPVSPPTPPAKSPVSPPTTPFMLSYSYSYMWGTCCFQHGNDADVCGTCLQEASPEQWCGQSAENCVKSCPRATPCVDRRVPAKSPVSPPAKSPVSPPTMSYSYSEPNETWGTCCFQHGNDADVCGTCIQAADPDQWCGQSAEKCASSCERATVCAF